MQREQGGVGVGAAHVHVLAKNGELFGQVAVQLRQFAETGLVVNPPFVPLLERVGAAAHHGDVEFVRAFDQCITHLGQLAQHLGRGLAHAGGDLDHAGRHLGHHRAGQRRFGHQPQHVLGVGGQVVVVGVDELQLQLNPQ